MVASSRQYLGPEQVAARLGLDSGVVTKLLRQRAIPGIHLGDTWVVPEPELEEFLASEFRRQNERPVSGDLPRSAPQKKSTRRGRVHSVRLLLDGRQEDMPNYSTAALSIIEWLASRDPGFLERFGAVRRGKRRYVSLQREDLYDGRGDLPARQMTNGWWLGTNYSRAELERMLQAACRLVGLNFGIDVAIRPVGTVSKRDKERAMSFVGMGKGAPNDWAENHDEYLTQIERGRD